MVKDCYYGSKKVEGIYVGSQNTNCLTYIPEDIKLDLDPLNVTVVGSPTVSNGVVSGFSKANYLKITSKFNTKDTWEIVGKFTTGSSFSSTMAIFHKEYALSVQISSDGKLDVYNWGSASHNYSSALSKNTTYWVKATVNGSTKARTVQYSTNGSTWTNVISNLTDSKLDIANTTYPAVFCGKSSVQDSLVFNGSISIPDTKIYKNGNLVWQGGTGQLTLKAGSKVYVPNGFETIGGETYYAWYQDFFGNLPSLIYTLSETPVVGDITYEWDASISQMVESGTVESFESGILNDAYTRESIDDKTTGEKIPHFDEVVISRDLTLDGYSNSNTKFILGYDVVTGQIDSTYNGVSGTTTPTSNCFFYNTSTNKLNYYNVSTMKDQYSFPLALFTMSNSVITSIDQVFNGFGYIGSTVFALKGVKGLIPDEFNENGTYKNIVVELDNVLLGYNFSSSWTRDKQPLFIGENSLITTGTANDNYYIGANRSLYDNKSYARVYDTSKNLIYMSGETAGVWEQESIAFLGYASITSGKITSLTINPIQPQMTTIPVKRVHKGADLIYIKQPVLLENNNTSTTSVYVEQGVYRLTLVGAGGGGGSGQADSKWYQSSGGSGACFKGLVYLPKGTYTFVIGTPGYGWNVNGSASCDHAVEGTDSYVQYNGTTILTCGVGVCGRNRASGGAGGTLTIGDIDVVSSEIAKNGNKGNNINPGTVSETSGYALSAYDNTKTGYGAGTGSWRYGGNVYGRNGYVKLEYIRAFK